MKKPPQPRGVGKARYIKTPRRVQGMFKNIQSTLKMGVTPPHL